MAKKGLIFRIAKKDITLLQRRPVRHRHLGISCQQPGRRSDPGCQRIHAHPDEKSWLKTKTKQLRVVPVAKSVSAEMAVMPFEAAEEIINKQSKIVVSPCICRKEQKMIGKGCDKPMEACLILWCRRLLL
jgi:electron transport complex protein RnfB